jgi:orotidine-5'-phosphate decarboxylase
MSAVLKYEARALKANSLLSVGLDPDLDKIPDSFRKSQFPQFEFNKYIIDQTAEYAAAFKPNMAAYEAQGAHGFLELEMTMHYLQKAFPDIFTICDAKRADIGYSSELYAKAFLDVLDFDSITLHPYLGKDGIQPFLSRKEKASIILCRTSNPGAGELQDMESNGKKMWQIIAEKVSSGWNENGNCMLVVGATYPEEMKAVRGIVGEMTLLVPGVGTQGGSVEEVMKAGKNSKGLGVIVNSTKGIMFSDNPAREAKKLRDEINAHR